MSHATLYVRFPDGEVRYGIYCGTSDVAEPWLSATSDEAWDRGPHQPRDWPTSSPDDAVVVDVATDYGGGFSWPGRATKDQLTDGFMPYGEDYYDAWTPPPPMTRGLPEWAL